MGTIRQRCADARPLLLEPEYLIGRAATCSLVLSDARISAQHALLRWAGGNWEIRDLGSRNGTFVNGSRLAPGRNHGLEVGVALSFGVRDEAWELVDDAPPAVMAVPLGGGPPVLIDGDFLGLPNCENPMVTIYRGPEGWVLEQPDSVVALENLHTFQLEGGVWRFCCPESVQRTELASPARNTVDLRDLELVFSVSRDEEYVHLRARSAHGEYDLGSRNHNYLLLMLARKRLLDRDAGETESCSGWVHLDDYAHDPSFAAPQINLDIFRIRKQFAALGVADPAAIVERRHRTRQLRLCDCSLQILSG